MFGNAMNVVRQARRSDIVSIRKDYASGAPKGRHRLHKKSFRKVTTLPPNVTTRPSEMLVCTTASASWLWLFVTMSFVCQSEKAMPFDSEMSVYLDIPEVPQ